MNNPYLKSLDPVLNQPNFVLVNEKKLEELAVYLKKECLMTPNWRESVLPEGDDGEFVDFLGLDSSINFCFTDPVSKIKFQIEYKGKVLSGSLAMSACLKRAMEEGIPVLDCRWLKKVTIEQMKYIFRGINPIPLIDKRTSIFQEIGTVLENKYDGHFYNLFEAAGYISFRKDKKGIVDRLIVDFPSFWDVSWHEPSQSFLQFHKRAQLYVIMYQGRALDSDGKLPLVFDADDLGPPADYRVPQVLRKLNILFYKRRLKKKIEQQKIVGKDSLEEQEIRAQMIYAMVRLCELTGSWIGPIDYQIWYAGAKLGNGEPHHLTPTIAY